MTLTPEIVEIEPCPFCGCTDVQSWAPGSVGWYVVECTKCHVRTPLIAPEAKAIETWNARAKSQRAVGVEELDALRNEVRVQSSLKDHYQDWDEFERMLSALIDRAGGGA
ncbi:MAG: Endodeoxyribonuclease toxin RalR [Luteibacter sp.]|uniref:Lar family restriction alleviation protein n=1 Tax=Luteibacter sp. TaxID=1886636 RepID=UPI00137DA68B|nr:Lar family restriction alleviation protein [Luteibacter sp.]KAF1006021.1 MAG: Endodeoxyribonuclease toxin RalR [Luteibacter sp.]